MRSNNAEGVSKVLMKEANFKLFYSLLKFQIVLIRFNISSNLLKGERPKNVFWGVWLNSKSNNLNKFRKTVWVKIYQSCQKSIYCRVGS